MAEPIEGQLVPQAPRELAARPKREPHTFAPALLLDKVKGEYKRIRMSDRERKFVNMYLKIGSIKRASAEIGISESSGKRYFRRPHIRAYLAQMQERQARAADLTMDKVGAVIGAAVDGVGGITAQQLDAAKAAAKMLAPRAGTSIVVNTQNNFNGQSPFVDLDQTAMLAEIKQNLLEMGE